MILGLTYDQCLRLIMSQLPRSKRKDQDFIQSIFLRIMQELPKFDSLDIKPTTFICNQAKWHYYNSYRIKKEFNSQLF